MKIFIFTYDRFDTIATPKFFEHDNLDYTVLCHTEEAKREFIKAGRVNPRKIFSSNAPKGLACNRNFALSQMEPGEWALFIVDDLVNFYEYEEYETEKSEDLKIVMENAKNYNKKFKKIISAAKFLERCEECIKKAEEEKVNLVGFAAFLNPLFLGKKWKHNVFADGRCWLVKKSNLVFDENVNSYDDMMWSAMNIKNGGLIVNQWVIPDCKRYSAGGVGSKEKRMEQKIKDCAYIERLHGDLVYFAKKPGFPAGSHLRIRNIKNRFN